MCSAVSTASAGTGRSNVIRKAVAIDAAVPIRSVASIVPLVVALVTKTARTEADIGRPAADRAPGATDSVWYVPADQCVVGVTLRTVPAEFQVVWTAVSGATVSAAVTLRGSIASLNVMSTTAWRSVAAPIDWNAESATASIGGEGGTACVGVGRARPIAATRTTMPTLATRAIRAATERRASTGR